MNRLRFLPGRFPEALLLPTEDAAGRFVPTRFEETVAARLGFFGARPPPELDCVIIFERVPSSYNQLDFAKNRAPAAR